MALDYKEKEIELALKDVIYNIYGLLYHMYNLAESFVNNNMFDRALPWAEKVVNTIPDDPDYIELLAIIYQGHGRYDDALEQFELCLELKKEDDDEESIRDIEDKISALKAEIEKNKK